jgi:hypothetical protein
MSIMRQHVFDCGIDNRAVNGNQEQRSESLADELRYLIAEFERGSPYFTSVEIKLLARAYDRLAQLEAAEAA